MNVSRHLPSASDQLPSGDGHRQAMALIEDDIRVCQRVLDEARRLVRTGQNGPVLIQFIRRAREILDEIQEIPLPTGTRQGAALSRRIACLRGAAESIRSTLELTPEDRNVNPPAEC